MRCCCSVVCRCAAVVFMRCIFLPGFGMGLMFNCAYLSVGYYFDKNRPLATALASSGTGNSITATSEAVKHCVTENILYQGGELNLASQPKYTCI